MEAQVANLQSEVLDMEGLRNRVQQLQSVNNDVGNDLRATRQLLVRMAPGSADLGAIANALEEGFRREYWSCTFPSFALLIFLSLPLSSDRNLRCVCGCCCYRRGSPRRLSERSSSRVELRSRLLLPPFFFYLLLL